MEVKNDVSKKIEPLVTGLSSKVTNSQNEQKSSDVVIESQNLDVDDVKLTDYSSQRQKTLEISKANEAITSLTQVADDSNQLDGLTQSIAGIADLADDESTTSIQRQTLNQETKQLSGVITTLAIELRAAKIITVPEEAARLALEKNLAEALDVFLPDPPRRPADLNVSTKEAILQTRKIISKAQAQIAKLRDSLKAELDHTVDYVNSQRSTGHSESLISEVDQAFKTSKTVSDEITASPVLAQLAIAPSSLTSSNALFK